MHTITAGRNRQDTARNLGVPVCSAVTKDWNTNEAPPPGMNLEILLRRTLGAVDSGSRISELPKDTEYLTWNMNDLDIGKDGRIDLSYSCIMQRNELGQAKMV
ncbi:hypothetical protein MGYG_05280 [Nannizzia gypsea CBS 118893]|uniref:Uncharacterized protein n=1 Tax=Arthroderma gypseum (strain ATCC MYA-4604 / CBS 118893) TaxID=535722 RepID=E4UVF3_ARTGP|nr:hypothetical protein MGYG_05280 [Nannizzia gypsea CBS 118893]EFR02280.1 hypothetical protein MGYG_05280 [Nannizzia gypsea CBS 118893]